jgi:monoterpene epsilon-lactone hydrolase
MMREIVGIEPMEEVMPSVELQALSDQLRATPFDPNAPLEVLRAAFPETPAPEGTTATSVDAGGTPAEWVVADTADPERRLLYLHGGGYVVCGPATHRDLAGRISKAANVAVLLLDYRLAPEHPYPAALNDATAALRWMNDHGPSGPSAARATFVAGDSAGGGLTLATLLATRDAGDRMPTAAVTISAWTDLTFTGASMRTRADVDPMLTADLLHRLVKEYLQGGDPTQPLVSPLYADLRSLPPLLMQVGDAEILLDDTTRVADKATAAGVAVSVEVYPEMMHIFQLFAPVLPEGQHAIERIGVFIRKTAAEKRHQQSASL